MPKQEGASQTALSMDWYDAYVPIVCDNMQSLSSQALYIPKETLKLSIGLANRCIYAAKSSWKGIKLHNIQIQQA